MKELKALEDSLFKKNRRKTKSKKKEQKIEEEYKVDNYMQVEDESD